MKVLIIEDREEYAELLKHHLKMITSEVSVALTIEEAFVILSGAIVLDLITVDLSLPGSSVDQTLEHLREIRNRQPDSVVVVVSGYLAGVNEVAVVEAGADGMIHKDEFVEPEHFIDRMLRVAKSILSSPPRFKRELAVVEMMAQKFTEYLRAQDAPHDRDIRASLA